ncbi:MAG: hypothetical protein Kow0092_20790 [Deferrisomatales bacterium]
MTIIGSERKLNIRVDRTNLYREESFTDLKAASLRRLVPVTPEGAPDPSRPALYMGSTTLISEMGPLPVQCVIEAGSLDEAMEKFPEAINEAVEKMIEEAREMQRRAATGIVLPDADVRSKLKLG